MLNTAMNTSERGGIPAIYKKLSALEYFFCLFSLTTFPVIKDFAPQHISPAYVTFGYLIANILIFRRFFRRKLRYAKPQILVLSILSLIILVLFYRVPYLDRFSGQTFPFLYTLYTAELRYISLAAFFLAYPTSCVAKTGNLKIERNIALAILFNSLVIPICYLLFGRFVGSLLYITTQSDLFDAKEVYNNYLIVSDTLLFNALLLFAYSRNLISSLLGFVSLLLLLLIGSRTSFVYGIIFICLELTRVIAARMKSAKRLWRLKTSSLVFFLLGLLVLSGLVTAGIVSGVFQDGMAVFNLDNIYNSRVWQTLVESDTLQDESAIGRQDAFACAFTYTFSSISTLLFGGLSISPGCATYVHSSLSIWVEYGAVVFFMLLYYVYACLKPSLKYGKSFRTIVTIAFLFLALGLTSRRGLGFYIPVLLLVYTQVTFLPWMNLKKRLIES